MANRSALTNEQLLAQFDELGDDVPPGNTPASTKDASTSKASAASTKPSAAKTPPSASPSKTKAAKGAATTTASNQNTAPTTTVNPPVPATADDPVAELGNLVTDRPKSRPHTPGAAAGLDPARSSDERVRKSADTARSFAQGLPSGDHGGAKGQAAEHVARSSDDTSQSAAASGWWGGLMATATATASAAVKQAEALAKEIQKNEEAQRWAEQVRGNVGALRSYGDELRSKALPTFTNILHTLAPPISTHERLQIHTTHDLVGYPSLDPLIYSTFARVMSQVEGGDLLVIQRGHDIAPRRPSDSNGATDGSVSAGGSNTRGYSGSGVSGWSDGPWWRQAERRDLGSVRGLVEGTKLARVSAEAYAHEYFAPRGGVEAAAQQAAAVLSETNPTRSSDIFLALQPIIHPTSSELFAASSTSVSTSAPKTTGTSGTSKDGGGTNSGTETPSEPEDLICFAIYLHDPIHSLTFEVLTQDMPARWASWLDNHPPTSAHTPDTSTTDSPTTASATLAETGSNSGGSAAGTGLPEDIRVMTEQGGVDPREWVAEWVEETLALGVGIVAQRYVARRMGVGEGGLGRSKARAEILEAGAGELARAL